MTIELTLDLDIRFVKYGVKHKAICDKYKMVGRSDISFEEAQKNLIEQIEIKIWSESFNLKINVKVKQ